jgi:hypothetical protein
MKFSNDPFPDDSRLEDEWFSKQAPTWRPPARQPSSRPPSAPPSSPALEDADVDGWFV